MANPSPKPRRPHPTHESRQISVFVPHELAEIIDTLRDEHKPRQNSLTLGRWLMLGQQVEQQMEEAMAQQD